MNQQKKVFLSYRRADSPGYVSKLEHDLENALGEKRVFRDVQDIQGGAEWKKVLNDSLEQAGALLVIIGPRWEAIWTEREDKTSDYIVYELNKANDLDVPIIPVTLNGARLSREIDLGPIAWLKERQFYDISDKQGRWPTDLQGLVNCISSFESFQKNSQTTPIAKDPSSPERIRSQLFPILSLCLIVAAALGFYFYSNYPHSETETNTSGRQEKTKPIDVIKPNSTKEQTSNDNISVNTGKPQQAKVSGPPIPALLGNWVSNKLHRFTITKNKQQFLVHSPELGQGKIEFPAKMPGKFYVIFDNAGHGEFTLSNSERKFIGWFKIKRTNEKKYLTFRPE